MDNTYIDYDIFLMNFLFVLLKKIKRYFDMKLLKIFLFTKTFSGYVKLGLLGFRCLPCVRSFRRETSNCDNLYHLPSMNLFQIRSLHKHFI